MTDHIRPRRDDDLNELLAVLAEQQPTSLYPITWPPPPPARNFVERPGNVAAWTAVRGGALVGHACVESPATDTWDDAVLVDAWSTAHQQPAEELAVVSALFTSTAVRGSGLGGRLLNTAVEWIWDQGLAACLSILPGPGPALAIYQTHGWKIVGESRPGWVPEGAPSMLALALSRSQTRG
ncbi:MAG: GNAT family N-acetyltransferase [Propionibacteriaceae bacterium]|nr:GNAT family N-acetyltransferase [Propionibacteriaceae bacterium]